MHDLRLIHTDLKPENILLVSSDYIKVPDYKVSGLLKNATVYICNSIEDFLRAYIWVITLNLCWSKRQWHSLLFHLYIKFNVFLKLFDPYNKLLFEFLIFTTVILYLFHCYLFSDFFLFNLDSIADC